jgi:hypothetical protein
MNADDSNSAGGDVQNSRLVTINQMILACMFGLGLLGFLFALMFSTRQLDQVTTTIVSNLLSVLGTVVVMQNTHFFKSGVPDPVPAVSGISSVPPGVPNVPPNPPESTASILAAAVKPV